jgi:hypothetical protein
VQSGDDKPSTATIIALQGVTAFPDLAPLSQIPTQISSLKTYVG